MDNISFNRFKMQKHTRGRFYRGLIIKTVVNSRFSFSFYGIILFILKNINFIWWYELCIFLNIFSFFKWIYKNVEKCTKIENNDEHTKNNLSIVLYIQLSPYQTRDW